jgi:hypothetical protein
MGFNEPDPSPERISPTGLSTSGRARYKGSWYIKVFSAKQELNIFIRGLSKKFGECYQKTNKTEDTNRLTLLAFKIIAILRNTLLATFIQLLETVS